MARVLYVLSVEPQQLTPLTERLKRNRLEPDVIPSLNTLPSSYMQISLTVTIFGQHQKRMVERIFDSFQVIKIEGPQHLRPTIQEKFVEHILDMWRESIAIFLGSIVAVHGAFFLALYLNNISEFYPSLTEFVELGLISAIPSVVHLLTGHRRYQDTII